LWEICSISAIDVHLAVDIRLRRFEQRRFQREFEILAHGQMRIERILLKHHRDIAFCGRELPDRAAGEIDVAAVRFIEPGYHAQRRGLSRSGRTQQNNEGATRDRQRQVVKRHVPPNVFVTSSRTTSTMAQDPLVGFRQQRLPFHVIKDRQRLRIEFKTNRLAP
jgi:hypothetical protein